MWELREEARKEWRYVLSDVTVYLCDLFAGELNGHTATGAIDWVAKCQQGDFWLELHGVFKGQRETEFDAIIEIASEPDIWRRLHVEAPVVRPSSGGPVFVDITEFIQMPQGMVPKSVPALVRLKTLEVVDEISERERDIAVNERVFNPDDVATAIRVVFFRDAVWVWPSRVIDHQPIKFAEMFFRPSNLHMQVV